MTKIEKAVKIVSDLYEFYRKIPKVSDQKMTREKEHRLSKDQKAAARTPEGPSSQHRRSDNSGAPSGRSISFLGKERILIDFAPETGSI